jgi:hypothetical protein
MQTEVHQAPGEHRLQVTMTYHPYIDLQCGSELVDSP